MNILSLALPFAGFRSRLEENRERLYRVAYSWCHNPALADDLVQETLSKALDKSAQLRDLGLMKSWLFSILTNCWRDHFRRHREMEDIDDLEDYRWSHDMTPEREHEQTEIVTRVRDAVARLPLGQRQVLTLVDLEEMSYAEVAEVLDIPVGTVMIRLCRARRALRESLTELGAEQAPRAEIRRVK
jgi:RNA polymerase sigma-70 factor (ECF subfamily)